MSGAGGGGEGGAEVSEGSEVAVEELGGRRAEVAAVRGEQKGGGARSLKRGWGWLRCPPGSIMHFPFLSSDSHCISVFYSPR